ncbi:F-box protein CPR1 [Beta vulgaris subsp. vulgaris]|uniref:F-box protein CPR1 n=1 Tax=Beta vulgaris subsp. vulgaris TaxID=3555 RepID=UPI002036D86D|nr:F-box protein CPR1 [Beta vulgaris subsp. vulgaris]
MADLPLDIITSILTRLPTKSLIRFKCVSKSWNSLIKSPNFVNIHLTQSLSSKKQLLIFNYGSFLESTPLKLSLSDLHVTTSARFDLPTCFSGYEVSVCGSCNGLLALVCKNVDDPLLFEIILWNPSTNIHFILPRNTHVDFGTDFMGVSFGFGYDCNVDDYRIVRIVDRFYNRDHSHAHGHAHGPDDDNGDLDYGDNGELDYGDGGFDGELDDGGGGGAVDVDYGDGGGDDDDDDDDDGGGGGGGDGDGGDGEDTDGSNECSFGFIYREVMVYSLRENTWKMIHVGTFGDKMEWFCPGAVINNHIIHWIFWKYLKDEPRLRGFDLSSGEWNRLPLPDFTGKQNTDCPNDADYDSFKASDIVVLGVLDECLCLVTRILPQLDNVYVWVMKEYGVEESWTKLFNVIEANIVGPLSSSPLASSYEEHQVLLRRADDEHGLCYYNLKSKTVKSVPRISSSLKLHDVNLCVESLVPIMPNMIAE